MKTIRELLIERGVNEKRSIAARIAGIRRRGLRHVAPKIPCYPWWGNTTSYINEYERLNNLVQTTPEYRP